MDIRKVVENVKSEITDKIKGWVKTANKESFENIKIRLWNDKIFPSDDEKKAEDIGDYTENPERWNNIWNTGHWIPLEVGEGGEELPEGEDTLTESLDKGLFTVEVGKELFERICKLTETKE